MKRFVAVLSLYLLAFPLPAQQQPPRFEEQVEVTVVEVATRHDRDIERLEEPRPYRRRPDIRNEDGRGSRLDLDLGAAYGRPHARQAIGERDRHDIRFLCDAPFELPICHLEPGRERR